MYRVCARTLLAASSKFAATKTAHFTFFFLQIPNLPQSGASQVFKPRFRTMASSLESGKIIGDVIDSVKQARVSLKIEYPHGIEVHDGVKIAPEKASSAPTVCIEGADAAKMYTLLCTDPDPPDPENPIYREWLHWVVADIPGSNPEATHGKQVTPYTGPSPPVGTHRYAFTLFEQPKNKPLPLQDPSGGSKGRKSFKTRDFANEHKLGVPVAAAYFLSHK